MPATISPAPSPAVATPVKAPPRVLTTEVEVSRYSGRSPLRLGGMHEDFARLVLEHPSEGLVMSNTPLPGKLDALEPQDFYQLDGAGTQQVPAALLAHADAYGHQVFDLAGSGQLAPFAQQQGTKYGPHQTSVEITERGDAGSLLSTRYFVIPDAAAATPGPAADVAAGVKALVQEATSSMQRTGHQPSFGIPLPLG